jgi:molybdopterin-guanine dinucleotide biosynthesis protein A
MNCSAVILAGGQSARMGRDKAELALAGETLLERQLKLAQAVGAVELLISGRAGQNYARFGCPVLTDNFPQAGPLAGIESALQVCRHPLLLVLAVDMPQLTSAVLSVLLEQSGGKIGIIPRVAGRADPLAALYPKVAAPLAAKMLGASVPEPGMGSPGAAVFAAQCVRAGWARYHDLPDNFAVCFKSWNAPQDVISL